MTNTTLENSLVLERRITASASRLFSAWTKPETMRSWLTPGPCVIVDVTTEVKVGGVFRIVSDAPDGARHTITGRYLQIEQNRRLKMTWLYQGPISFLDGLETVLEIDLVGASEHVTDLRITQTRIPTQVACDAFQGDWPSCLDKLENVLGRPLQ